MACMVSWGGCIRSPSARGEWCCDVRVSRWSVGCWTLGLGQRPACSAEHQEVFSKHWESGKGDQKWVNSILTAWFLLSRILCPVAVVPTGTLHRCTGYIIFYMHMYFYVHVNAHKKYAYKQLINRRRNLICGLIPFFVPLHHPRDRGTHISWNCPRIHELTSLPTANVSLHHTHKGFKEWEALLEALHTAGPQFCLFSFLDFLLVSAFSCSGTFLRILKNFSFSRGECFPKWPLCSSPLSPGPSFNKALSTFFSWSICLCIFLKHGGWM